MYSKFFFNSGEVCRFLLSPNKSYRFTKFSPSLDEVYGFLPSPDEP